MTPELENKINQYYALSWSDSQKTDIASTLICDLIEEVNAGVREYEISTYLMDSFAIEQLEQVKKEIKKACINEVKYINCAPEDITYERGILTGLKQSIEIIDNHIKQLKSPNK